MARGRMLSRTLGSSRRFNALNQLENGRAEFSQLLFALLIPHTDDEGRMSGDAYTIKLTVCPGSSRSVEDVEAALRAMHAVQLITVYEAKDDIWLQVNRFETHQQGLSNRTASKIPAPKTTDYQQFPTFANNCQQLLASRARAEVNLREGNLTKENRTTKKDRG